jgi:superfamily I DNA/RNA helicase
MQPTKEQQAILDQITASPSTPLMINALAGTGKSATLKLIDQVHKTTPALYLVFAKRNQLEAVAAQKAGEFATTTRIKTFNGLGHGIWANSIAPSITLDKDKTRNAWRALIDDLTPAERTEVWSMYSVVMDGVEKAKSLGYVPSSVKFPHKALIDRSSLHRVMDERPSDHAAEIIDDILFSSITKAYAGVIDFNDQIYMPALFGGAYPRFPRIMVDEYQDQSPVNHALLARLVKGNLIGVGDPNQNIYGFRGAKSGGMASAVETYGMHQLPLSISFRCPSAIVEAARWHVPHFQYATVGGSVHSPETCDASSIGDGATIICRNNAPLLRFAFKLISTGRSVSVMGSDLGPRLINIMKKLGDSSIPQRQVLINIEAWREAKILANSKSANDLADCMTVFAEHGDSLGQAISYAEHLFAQKGTISLLTGHKSKGLEFDDVYWLDPGLVDTTTEQDANLAYVITTRSKNKLTMIDSSSVLW